MFFNNFKRVCFDHAGSSDDGGGGGGGGDTDAGRCSDDDRSVSSGDSSSGDRGRGGGGGDGSISSRSRSSSANSNRNNNNVEKETLVASSVGNDRGVVDSVIGATAGLNSGFNFFELPANATTMPYNFEVRNAGAGGVWTKSLLPKGIKYGPFLGKWGPKPDDSRFAWEVSE